MFERRLFLFYQRIKVGVCRYLLPFFKRLINLCQPLLFYFTFKSIAIENEITFKNIPEQFVQINNERLSLTFKLTPADNKEILLPNKSTVITSKKQCFLTLKRVLFDGDSNAFEIEEKIKRGGRTYEFLPFKAELTLIN